MKRNTNPFDDVPTVGSQIDEHNRRVAARMSIEGKMVSSLKDVYITDKEKWQTAFYDAMSMCDQ